MSKLKNPDIKITCPHCGQQSAKKLSWLKDNDTFPCVCGATIEAKGLLGEIAGIEKSLESLKKGLGNINI